MKAEYDENVFVRVKDMAGNDFLCPLNALRDAKSVSEAEWDNCFEGDVVERYAGLIDIVER